MKRIALLFVLSFFLLSCSGTNKRHPSNDGSIQPTSRHIIFLVHGIGGNHTTFIKMNTALEKHLEYWDPATEYRAQNLYYSTEEAAKNGLNTTAYAKVIGAQINKYFEGIGGLQPTDKISFITHSQGGLVSLIWLYHTYLLTVGEPQALNLDPGDFEGLNPQYFKHVKNFITLGTPFWGAKLAPLGVWIIESCSENVGPIRKKICQWSKNLTKLIGAKEVKGLAFSNPTIHNFRTNTLKMTDEAFFKVFRSQIRPLNIAGVALDVNMLLELLGSGRRLYESDVAVAIPSARYDFIHGQALNSGYSDGEVLKASEFEQTPFNVPFILTNAFHALLINPTENVVNKPEDQLTPAERATLTHKQRGKYSLAAIGIDCYDSLECDHPAFKTIVYHILGDEVQDFNKIPEKEMKASNELYSQMTAYMIDLSVKRDITPEEVKKINDPNASFHPGMQLSVTADLSLNETERKNGKSNEGPKVLMSVHKSPTNQKIYQKLVKYGDEVRWTYDNFRASPTLDGKYISARNYFLGSAVRSYIPSSDPNKPGTWKDRIVKLTIMAPGYKTRVLEVKVKPTYTTFAEVYMEPGESSFKVPGAERKKGRRK